MSDSSLPTGTVTESFSKCLACGYDELLFSKDIYAQTTILTNNGNDLCLKHWDWCVVNMPHYTVDDPSVELYLERKGFTDNIEWRTKWFRYYEANGRSPQ